MTDGPTPGTLRSELDDVVQRHNELVRETPGYVAAIIAQHADWVRATHNVAVEAVHDPDAGPDGAFAVSFEDGTMFVFGVGPNKERLAALQAAMQDETDQRLAMLVDRGLAPAGGGQS